MGQTVGKQVERKKPKAIIFEKPPKFSLNYEDFYSDPMKFIETKLEQKEKIDQWAFKWSHWIIEEVFVRPDFDVQRIMHLIGEADLGDVLPQIGLKSKQNISFDFSKDTKSLMKNFKGKSSE